MNESATTLRWVITHHWGNPDYHPKALDLIDDLVGYPLTPGGDERDKPPSKVALVIGHNSRQRGAFADGELNQFEYDFNHSVVYQLMETGVAGAELRCFTRKYAGSYHREIIEVYREVNEWAPDLVVELHFNAGGGDYTTMLCGTGRERSLAVAAVFQRHFVDALGTGDGGVIAREREDRGGRSLFASEAPMVLTEPFFGDHPEHQATVMALGHEGIARIYHGAIRAALEALAGLSQH